MFELRPYQKPIATKVFKYMVAHPNKHPLVAMPTGSGKTVVMADIIHKALSNWPNTHILILSHVKEILDQDYRAISKHLKEFNISVGLYSAGFNRREVQQVTVAGIQSVYRNGHLFSDYNLIIIDECHLIPNSDTSMYRTFFSSINNPRYLGLTATPFRLDSGYIYNNKESIFDDLIVDLTTSDRFTKLIDDGYLCDLKTQGTKTEFDTRDIGTRGGDFDAYEMSAKFNRDEITKSACKEIVKFGADCKKWLIFAIDIKHAESIADTLISMGIPTLAIHSKMEFDRDWTIKTFKEGKIRAIVNVNVLTTGFDDPEIDLIALLRPTKSPVIHIQTIGRGLRPAQSKSYCLILDFAGNTRRLGPINEIRIKKIRKGQDPNGDGDAPTKTCPHCEAILSIRTMVCPWCEYKFPEKSALEGHAIKSDPISRKKSVEWYDVSNVNYIIHAPRNKPKMAKVSYQCGLQYFNEYVCIEHKGYAKHKADHWVKFRGGHATNVEELISEADTLKKPKRIKVDRRGNYPIVIDAEF